MTNLSHYKILNEADDSYHVASPSGKTFTLDKKGMSDRAHEIVRSLRGQMPQGFDDGGTAIDLNAPQVLPQSLQSPSIASENQSPVTVTAPAPQEMVTQEPTTPFGGRALGVDELMQNSKAKLQAETNREPAGSPAQAQIASAKDSAGTSGVSKPAASSDLVSNSPYKQEIEAMRQIGNIEAKSAAEQAALIKEENARYDKMSTQSDIVAANKQASDTLFKQYSDQKIDPDKYWQNHSKVAAGIGLLLGGLGGGMAHTGNQAAEFLENNMNREIAAQRANADHAHTLWGMNRQALGDDLSANLATQNQYLTGLKYKLLQASTKYQGPLAQQRTQMGIAQINQKILMNSAITGMARGQPGTEEDWNNKLAQLSQLSPENHKELQARTMPGEGIARVPMTPENRDEIMNYNTFGNAVNRAIEFQRQMGASGAWTPKNKAEAQGHKDELIAEMNKVYDKKRDPNGEMFKIYQDAVNGIGSINFGSTMVKLKDLETQALARKQEVKRGLGIVPFVKASPLDQAVAWAKQNPNDPNAAAVLEKVQRLKQPSQSAGK